MKKRNIFLFYLVLIFFVFSDFPKTFFQQDEWAIFGDLLYWEKAELNWFERLFVYEQDVHILPFSNLLSYFQFKLFKLNFAPYTLFGILLHTLNSFLVFYLSYLVLEKKWLSFIVGILFAVNSISHQAVTWVATTTGTVNACLLLLLTLIFFARIPKQVQNDARRLSPVIIMLIFSLGFKETSIFLFALLPLFWLLFAHHAEFISGSVKIPKQVRNDNQRLKVSFQKAKKVFTPFIIFAFLYFCLRVFLLINAPPPSAPAEAVSQPTSLMVYFYRLFTLPAKAISQSFIPANLILGLARVMTRLAYPHFITSGVPDPYIVESVAADIISYAFTLIILILFVFTFKYLKSLKEDNLYKSLIFSLSFIALGSLPFIFIAGKAGYFSIFEPRHFYILSFGSSLFLGIMILAVNRGILKQVQDDGLKKVLFFIFLIPIILFHIFKIKVDIKKQVEIGQLRRSVLNQISRAYPKLPEKVIFYTESDKAFYGLPPEEKIFPFQSGFGQTLLVWYDIQQEEFPACFFKDKFLYVLLSEDYKFCQGRGFGYFRKFDKLAEVIRENNLSRESVIAFYYNSKEQSLTDVTSKIRSKL